MLQNISKEQSSFPLLVQNMPTILLYPGAHYTHKNKKINTL
jgi:hypothetical protein